MKNEIIPLMITTAKIRKYHGHYIAVKDKKQGILSGEVRYNGGNRNSYYIGKNKLLYYGNLEKIFINPKNNAF